MRIHVLVCCALVALSACRRGSSADAPAARGGDVSESGEGIPSSVFGGGTPVTVVVEGTSRLRVHFGFERGSMEDPDHKYVERWQQLPAGKHTFTISVPPNVSGGLDVNLEEPAVGDKASASVTCEGRTLDDAYTLEQPLEPGTAAFAQVNVEDWVKVEPSTD